MAFLCEMGWPEEYQLEPNLPAGECTYSPLHDFGIITRNCTFVTRSRTSSWTNPIRWRTWVPCGITPHTEDENSQEDGSSGHVSTKKSSFPQREACTLFLNPQFQLLSSKQMAFPTSQKNWGQHIRILLASPPYTLGLPMATHPS